MKRLLIIFICVALLGSLSIPVLSIEEDIDYRTLTIIAPNWTDVYIYTETAKTYSRPLDNWPGTRLQMYSNVYMITLESSVTDLQFHGMDSSGNYVECYVTLEDNREELAQRGEGLNATISIKPTSRGRYDAQVVYDSQEADDLASFFYDLGRQSNYRVVGDADWFGAGDPGNDLCTMREVTPGIFRRTIYCVIPGEYKLKVTKDGTWEGAYGDATGDYLTFTMTSPGTVGVELKYQEDGALLSIYTNSFLNSFLTTFPNGVLTASPNGVPNSPQLYPFFLFTFGILAVCIYLWFLFQRRASFSGDVTPAGTVSRRTRFSKKAVIQTVKENSPAPPPELDQTILEAIKNVKRPNPEP